MPQKGDTPGQTAPLFPDLAPPGRRRAANLREAATLFDVRSEVTTTDEHPGPARDLKTGDLFAWGARQEQIRVRGRAPGVGGRAQVNRPVLSLPDRRAPRSPRPGLTRCLDGSGTGPGAAGRGSRVVRNRVLFALLVVAVAVYVALRIALHR